MSGELKNNPATWPRRLLLFAMLSGVALGMFVLSMRVHHNFHVVSPGLVYRSAQMDATALVEFIPRYGIKSILNLRGAGEDKDWYRAEVNTARRLGVAHFDYSLSASRELKDGEMDEILDTIRKAPKPILIHCQAGADRTGLVGALYLYSVEGQPAQSAQHQMTVLYGHVPQLFWSGTIAMDNSFWRYVKNHAQTAASAADGSAGAANPSSSTGPCLTHNLVAH